MALDPKYMISPNLQEVFIDAETGLPMVNGQVFYYKDNSRSDLKTVYELSGSPGSYSFTALPNPITLNGSGSPTNGSGQDVRVYYYPYDSAGNVENYYIVAKNEAGVTKVMRQAWPNIPGAETGGGTYDYNFVRNNSWYVWTSGTNFTNVGTGSTGLTDYIIPDWTYQQDDATQTISVSRGTFLPGDNYVDGNPPYYLIYHNTNSGSDNGTYNRFSQTYSSVQTLSGQNVVFSIWLNQSSDGSPDGQFSMTLRQYFGTGGSPSATVTTTVLMVPLISRGTWTLYTGTVLLPSIVGKTIGTNGDDCLILDLNMPLNQTAQVNIGPSQFRSGTTLSTPNEISNDDIKKQTNYTGLYPAWTTGDVKMTIKNVADIGWLMMNDQTIGNPSSGATSVGWSLFALYSLIWTNVNSNIFAPIYTSSGAASTYGANALADWNANKRLSLTKALGRVLAGANPTPVSIVTKTFTISNSGGNILVTVDDASSFLTGTVVQVSAGSGGSLSGTGLSAATNYYTVWISSTTFKLATSLANALLSSPTVIAYSGAGTSPLNIFTINTAHPFASFTGEDTHALTIAEMPAHNHGIITYSGSSPGSNNNVSAYNDNSQVGNDVTTNTGGSTAHNIIQPTTYLNVMVKI